MLGWYELTSYDTVASWIYVSDTVVAPRFSRPQFRMVTAGTSIVELVERLGEPLDRRLESAHREYWFYSRHGSRSENYWNFIVLVDPVANNVVECFKEFYTD
jgi:hypothetical protein